MQFKAIEQNLNKLCSQHDEYMSLLDIADYLTNIKVLTQNNKNYYSRITALEQSIQEIHSIRIQQNTQQRDHSFTKLQKFKKNIAQIQEKLQSYSSFLTNFDGNIKNIQKDSNHFTYYKDINTVNANILQVIDKQTNGVQNSVALYKNQLECKVLQTKQIAKEIYQQSLYEASNQAQYFKKDMTIGTIIENSLKDQLEQYDKLAHQIYIFKLQFPIPQLRPFLQHNYEGIKQQISALLSLLSVYQETITMSDLNVLRQEYETLFYRTKALKNYALSELLQLYEKSNTKLSVNKIEKQVGAMVKQLQNRLQLLNEILQRTENQRSFIKIE